MRVHHSQLASESFGVSSRRSLLQTLGTGLGSLGLAGILGQQGLLGQDPALVGASQNPLAPKQPMFPARAKRIIHLFMNGGPSHVDTFDPKPELQRRGGQAISTGNLSTERPTGALFPSPFRFRRYGVPLLVRL